MFSRTSSSLICIYPSLFKIRGHTLSATLHTHTRIHTYHTPLEYLACMQSLHDDLEALLFSPVTCTSLTLSIFSMHAHLTYHYVAHVMSTHKHKCNTQSHTHISHNNISLCRISNLINGHMHKHVGTHTHTHTHTHTVKCP